MSKSKVLWVENEPERLVPFRKLVEFDGSIELVPIKDAESAIAYLDDNVELLTAAVLDIESFLTSDSTDEHMGSFIRVRDSITRLENRNKLQYFAFSGKRQYTQDPEFFEKTYGCKIFDKNCQSEEAISYLRLIVKQSDIANILHRYGSAFSLPLDESATKDLLRILLSVEKSNHRDAECLHLVRNVMDWVMQYCYEIGLSQVKFTGTNLADCSRFMGDKLMKEFVPVHIASCMRQAVDLGNNGSHKKGDGYQAVLNGQAPYLIRSATFSLLTVLNWLTTLPADEESVTDRDEATSKIFESYSNKF